MKKIRICAKLKDKYSISKKLKSISLNTEKNNKIIGKYEKKT